MLVRKFILYFAISLLLLPSDLSIKIIEGEEIIQKIKILAEEALQCNIKLFSVKGKESENFKYKLRMDKIEKKLTTSYKKTEAFVKNFGLNNFIKSAVL